MYVIINVYYYHNIINIKCLLRLHVHKLQVTVLILWPLHKDSAEPNIERTLLNEFNEENTE